MLSGVNLGEYDHVVRVADKVAFVAHELVVRHQSQVQGGRGAGLQGREIEQSPKSENFLKMLFFF